MFETLFGSELPLPVRFFLAFLLVFVLIVLPTLIFAIRFRTRLRRLIIRVSEALALLIILVSTVVGGLVAAGYSLMRSNMFLTGDQEIAKILYATGAFIIGGVSAFVFTAVGLAMLFILVEIAENTRRTVAFFERVDARAQR
jgi:hypothetical protein